MEDKEKRSYLLSGFLMGLIVGIFLIPYCTKAHALDRCQQYIPEIRKWSFHYLGIDYPYHYNVGVAQTESSCRPDITSFDGGEGLFQFTGKTKDYVRSELGENIVFYNPSHAIKAQAFYMAQLHKQNWDGALWLTYCFNNSGTGTMKKEYRKTSCSQCHKEAFYDEMKAVCSRRIVTLKNGNKLDLCDVGYGYVKKVFYYGQKYKIYPDGSWRYW